MNIGTVVVLMALIALAAWTRYLYHKSNLALKERAGDSDRVIEMRERWHIRRGIMTGTFLLLLGLVIFLGGGELTRGNSPVVPSRYGPALDLAAFAVAAMGFIVLVANALWSRSAGRRGSGRPGTPASGEDSENQENQP